MFRNKIMRPPFSISKYVSICLAFVMAAVIYAPPLWAQSASTDDTGLSALVSRQQQRMDLLEEGLKGVRGTIEMELQNIRTEIESLAASSIANQSGASSDVKSIQGELAKLADNIAIVSQRINNTLNLYSDIEFRILRLEKRLNTLLSLSSDEVVDKLAQGEVSAAGAGPSVAMSRDAKTGQTVWTIDKEQLEEQLAQDNASRDETAQTTPDAAENSAIEESPASPAEPNAENPLAVADVQPQSDITTQSQTQEAVEASPSILPDASSEDQFRFALTRALQNDLETAEKAFIEFSELYPEHERSADALFWLGRVQFIQGEFEKSATTFSKFNALYSTDPRLPDTTLWIAESVSKFAAPEQACDIYDNLGKFLDQPPESFVARLKELSDGANCSS
jgi:TolA-binding protein